MKIPHLSLSLALSLVPVTTFAMKNYPCSGAEGSYRTNPDSTEGGFVASTAVVDSSIYLDLDASVCDRATVIEGVKLKGRAEVSGRATVRGHVIIQDDAKVYGEAYVINPGGSNLVIKDYSKVYGRGYLMGSVVVANTSEIFGWAKLIDYAQVLGNSRVCGNALLQENTVIIDDMSLCVQ